MDLMTNASLEDFEEEFRSSDQTSIEEVEIDPVSFWTSLGYNVINSTVRVGGYLLNFETFDKIAEKNGFNLDRKKYHEDEIFDDYLARMNKVDLKSAIVHPRDESERRRLLVISDVDEVSWPPPVDLSPIKEDEQALKDKEWIVGLGAEPSELEWASMVNGVDVFLWDNPLLTPQRIKPPRTLFQILDLNDPHDYAKCPGKVEVMEIFGEGEERDKLDGL